MKRNKAGSRACTMNFEGLARLGLDPFAVDISRVFLEQRRVVQLKDISILIICSCSKLEESVHTEGMFELGMA